MVGRVESLSLCCVYGDKEAGRERRVLMSCQPRTNLMPAHIQRLPPLPEGLKGTAGAQVTDTKQCVSDR